MRDTYYLILNKNGVDRMVHKEPTALKSGEFAIKQVVEIPDEAFLPVIIPLVTVQIPTGALLPPVRALSEKHADPNVIDAEVIG